MNPTAKVRKHKKKTLAKKKLELFHSWSGAEEPPVDALVDAFQKKHPDIKVSKNVLDWTTYTKVIKEKIGGASPPDVFSTEVGQRAIDYAKSKKLADLTGIWEQEGLSEVFPKWMKDSCTYNGKIYGIPSKEYTFVVWYLTKVFKQQGVEPPQTWEELLEVCRAFKESGVTPIMASGSEGTFIWFMHILANTAGPEFYSGLMKGKKRWTDPKVIDAYEILRDLSKEYFYKHPFGYNFRIAWIKLNRYEAAMQLQGDWLYGMWQRQFNLVPGKDYDYFLFPLMNSKVGQVMALGGNAWVLPENSRNSEKAKTFLKYASSAKAHEIMAKKGMGVLAHKDVPPKTYNNILGRLRDDSRKCLNVPEMGVAFPPELVRVEEFQRIQIIMDPTLTRNDIKEMVAEIERRARDYFRLEQLYAT